MTTPGNDLDFDGLRRGFGGLVEYAAADELIARARARRSRRRAQGSVFAAVLAVAVAVPIWFVSRQSAVPPAGQHPVVSTSTPREPSSSKAESSKAGPSKAGPSSNVTVPALAPGPWGFHAVNEAPESGASFAVDFADPRHGFAVRQTCTANKCVTVLLVTSDGRTWIARATPMPTTNPPGGRSPEVVALGPTSVLLTESAVGFVGSTWFSGDAGKTWTSVPSYTSSTVAAAPPRTPLILQCQGEQNLNVCRRQLAALSSVTGRLLVLAHQPALTVDSYSGPFFPSADGSIWVSGSVAGGAPAVAVTRDGGQSWRVSSFTPQPNPVWSTSVAGSAKTLYASVIGELPDVKNGLLALYRSVDSGSTWTRTWTAATGALPRTAIGGPIVQPDGTVFLLSEDNTAWRSRDGRTFVQVESPTSLSSPGVARKAAGYLVFAGAWALDLSFDGVTWTRIVVPSS